MAAIRHRAAVLAALALAGADAGAADFDAWIETRDWYVSLGVAPAPEVEEETSGPGGTSTYEWKDPDREDEIAPRLALGYLACSGGNRGGWALGAELVATTCETTPRSYEVSGLTFANTSGDSLRYTTAGVTLYGGYQFGIDPDPEEISAFLLLTPFIGGGVAFADSEVRDQNGAYASDSGVGWYLEGGLRAGVFLTERNWVAGVLVDLTIGTGEVDIDFGDGTSSTLTHDRLGVGGSLVIGYRL
jgi:hypothetical protein